LAITNPPCSAVSAIAELLVSLVPVMFSKHAKFEVYCFNSFRDMEKVPILLK